MISTPEEQSDMKEPNSGGQKGVPDERARLIKESVEGKGNRQNGDGGASQASVPPDLPKE